MYNFKKLGVLGLTVLASTSFIAGVKADEAYYRISDMKKNDTVITYQCGENTRCPLVVNTTQSSPSGPFIANVNLWEAFSSNDGSYFQMKIKGYNLNASTVYLVAFGSSEPAEATGQELMNGYIVSTEMVNNGAQILSITEKGSATPLKYATYMCDFLGNSCTADPDGPTDESETTRFASITFNFPTNSGGSGSYTEYTPTEEEIAVLDAVFAKIAPNNIIIINSINPYNSNVDENLEDSLISAALNRQFGNLGYSFMGYADDNGNGDIQIIVEDEDKTYSKIYCDVVYKYTTVNENIKSITDEIANLIKQNRNEVMNDFYKRYIIEDLDVINYYYNTQKSKNKTMALYGLPSYSTKLQEKIGNKNIDFVFDPRAGDAPSDFHTFVLGPINILYNGEVYSNVDPVGFALNNILYIDSNVEKDDDAFIAAAKKRLSSYLKGVEIEIVPVGAIGPEMEEDYSWYHPSDGLVPFIDIDKTTGSVYSITIGEEEYPFFIVADSEKQVTPALKTLDMNSNVYMLTDSFETPLDAKINATKLDKNSTEYKALAKKLNIIQGLAYELNLFSNSLDMYITKLDNGKFKVYIPVDEAITKKALTAVYLKEDGTLESHPVTFEGNYAVFETDHFSTYALVDTKNPKTGDNIVLYILMLSASGYALYKVRKGKLI